MSWHFELTDAPTDGRDFDRFLICSRFAAYQQSRAWVGATDATRRHGHLYFRASRAGATVGAAIVRQTRLAGGFWLATIQRGPVVDDPAHLEPVLGGLRRLLEEAGCCSVQLAPRVRGRDLPVMCEAMRRLGFVALPADRQPLHAATGIVWLDKPEDEILAGFKQRARRQLKAAARGGVTIRPVGGQDDVRAYQHMLDAFAASHPDYDMNGLPDAAGQSQLIASLGGGMLLAMREGAVIGGHAFVRQADEAIWLSMATTGDDPSIPRTYSLLWEGMRLARTMGCVGYDLAGIPIDEPKDAGEANRLQFKNAFAPTRRILPPMHVAAIRPVAHAVLFSARQAYRAWHSRRSVRRAAA